MISEPNSSIELTSRANRLVTQHFLPVHYYRIRKRLALPLPITEPISTAHTVRAFSIAYPWAIWLTWALEDRMLTLGEYVCQTGDAAAQKAVEYDLYALSGWQSYRESARPDLPFAHAVLVLWVAHDHWGWLSCQLRTAVRAALQRAVADALPLSDGLYGQFESVQAVLATEHPHQHLHNIPLIETCVVALAAKAVAHPAAARLDARVALLFEAVLSLRQQGFTEGVSYDGYVLSFMADWLSTLDAQSRSHIFTHPGFASWVEQVVELAAPGDVMATAPLGDVEPLDMPFVWSALAKLQALQANPRAAWALSQCDVSRLRADALAALGRMPVESPQAPAVQSPALVNYALVLRTGYAADDVAVAMGLSHSPMGHIHCDNGSLVLSTRGRWWLDDPGYQQYLQTTERQFTVGAAAHNAPVLNGHAQVHKKPELVAVNRLAGMLDVQFALVDLTACYAAKAGARRVRRAVWLVGNQHLVVCDEVCLAAAASVAYHWHGHPSLYWCMQDGAATMVSADDADRWLHVACPQVALSPADLHRLPGSRGQQTLSVTLYPPSETAVWWVFSFAAERPVFSLTDKAFVVGGRVVPIDERIALPLSSLQPFPTSYVQPLSVTAVREGSLVKGQCVASSDHFSGELEYAFYLMVGGKKALVQWYTPSPEVVFSVPDDAQEQPLEVRGFVREKAKPDNKMMRAVAVPPASTFL